MIETFSDIGDPVQFVAANTELVDQAIARSDRGTHQTTGTEHVIGEDLDIEISYLSPVLKNFESDNFERLEDGDIKSLKCFNVATSLGGLYQLLKGNFRYGEHSFSIFAYPSASRVNNLASALGLNPGVDIPSAYTVVNRGEIGRREFVDLLHRRKHPRGVREPGRESGIFHHDRDSNHVPGVLWMPPNIACAVFEEADFASSGFRPKILDGKKNRLVADYEALTNKISEAAHTTMTASPDDSLKDRSVESLVQSVSGMSIANHLPMSLEALELSMREHFEKMKINTLDLQRIGYSAFQVPIS